MTWSYLLSRAAMTTWICSRGHARFAVCAVSTASFPWIGTTSHRAIGSFRQTGNRGELRTGAEEIALVRSGLDDTMRLAYQTLREVAG